MKTILICIQARSGSKRLPGKSFELIDDAIMVEHVLAPCKKAAYLINRDKDKTGVSASACVLIPTGDPLKEAMAGNVIVEGSENDVLSRFELAHSQYSPDYIVRITGDCPMIFETLIVRHIFCAVINDLDYVTNTFDDMRTYIDGHDVEVISSKLMKWVFRTAESPHDKEHVTTIIKSRPPLWAKMGVMIGRLDLSHIKLSVDTKEELEEVRINKDKISNKIKLAVNKHYRVFRF